VTPIDWKLATPISISLEKSWHYSLLSTIDLPLCLIISISPLRNYITLSQYAGRVFSFKTFQQTLAI